MYALQRQLADVRKRLKNERRGHSNHHVSQHVKVRQNVSNRLKARQMCVDTNAISEKNSLINCTGHPIIMHRITNTNSRTSNAINTQRVCQTRVHKSLIGNNLPDTLSPWGNKTQSTSKTSKSTASLSLAERSERWNDGRLEESADNQCRSCSEGLS